MKVYSGIILAAVLLLILFSGLIPAAGARVAAALVVLLAAPLGMKIFDWVKALPEPEAASLESFFKVVAFGGATCFFLYKLMAGWFIINMIMGIRTERTLAEGTASDHLALTVTLDKGSTDSLHIQDMKVRIAELDKDAAAPVFRDVPISGFKRLAESGEGGTILWSDAKKAPTTIAISPGEKAEFATYIQVPHGKAVLVEAVVLGDRFLSRDWNGYCNQWRASAVSLPAKLNEK